MSPTSLPPDPQRSREELLGIVRTRTTLLRRRRRVMIGSTLALVLAVLGGGVAITRGPDSGPSLRVTTDQGLVQPVPESLAPTTTVTSAPMTTTSSSPHGAVVTTSTTRPKAQPTSSTTATTEREDGPTPTTATTMRPEGTPECRQSTDPRCGPFRWEPAPTKHPLTVQLSVLTERPVAGKPVQFKVVADELDTELNACFTYEGTGVSPSRTACPLPSQAPCPSEPKAYGPWAPPEQMPDRIEDNPAFTYDKPGTYTLTYTFSTDWPPCSPWGRSDPYANTGTGSVTFTVHAPAEGESSTTTSTKPSEGQ